MRILILRSGLATRFNHVGSWQWAVAYRLRWELPTANVNCRLPFQHPRSQSHPPPKTPHPRPAQTSKICAAS